MRIFRAAATFLLFGCLFLALSAGPALAAAKKPAPPPDWRKLVRSVDKGTNSIVIVNQRTKDSHTYRLDDMSVVKIDGAPANFSAIKAGMEISDLAERDNDDLDSLSLLSKSHAPVVGDDKKATVTGATKTIQTVLADKNSVVIFYKESKIERIYHIDANTELKVNGVAGSFSDIKAGMQVQDYMERDNDDLDSLTVTGY